MSEEIKNNSAVEKLEYLTYLQAIILLSISLPTLKSYIKKGILTAYRLKGTNRKYIKRSDIENAFEIIPIPKASQSYEQLETSFRQAIARGKQLKKIEVEYIAITENPSISGFCQWIYENKRADLVSFFNGAIQLSDTIQNIIKK